MNNNLISEIIAELSYRCNDGIPDLKNVEHIKILSEILSEMGVSDRNSILENLITEDDFDKAFGDTGGGSGVSTSPNSIGGGDDGEESGQKPMFSDLLNDPATLAWLTKERDILNKLADLQSFETKINRFRNLIRILSRRKDKYGNLLGCTSTERGSLIIGVERGTGLESTKELVKMLKTLPGDVRVKFIGSDATIDSYGNYKYRSEQNEIKTAIQYHFATCEYDIADDILDIVDIHESPLIDALEDELSSRDAALAATWLLTVDDDMKLDARNYITMEGKKWLLSQIPEHLKYAFSNVDFNRLTFKQQEILEYLIDNDSIDSEIAICKDIFNSHKNSAFYKKIKNAETEGFIAIAIVPNYKVFKLKEYDINGVLLESKKNEDILLEASDDYQKFGPTGTDWESLITLAFNGFRGTPSEREKYTSKYKFTRNIYKLYYEKTDNNSSWGRIAFKSANKIKSTLGGKKMVLLSDSPSGMGYYSKAKSAEPYTTDTTKTDMIIIGADKTKNRISLKKSDGSRIFQGSKNELTGIFTGAKKIVDSNVAGFKYDTDSVSDVYDAAIEVLNDFPGGSITTPTQKTDPVEINKKILKSWVEKRIDDLFDKVRELIPNYNDGLIKKLIVRHALYEMRESGILPILVNVRESKIVKLMPISQTKSFSKIDGIDSIKIASTNEIKQFVNKMTSYGAIKLVHDNVEASILKIIPWLIKRYAQNELFLKKIKNLFESPEFKTACVYEGATGLYKFGYLGSNSFNPDKIKIANVVVKIDQQTGNVDIQPITYNWAKNKINEVTITTDIKYSPNIKKMYSSFQAIVDSVQFDPKAEEMIKSLFNAKNRKSTTNENHLYEIITKHFVREELLNNTELIKEEYNRNLSILNEDIIDSAINSIDLAVKSINKTMKTIIDLIWKKVVERFSKLFKELFDKGLDYLLDFIGIEIAGEISGDIVY